jgi:pyridoxine 5-phosphate synthase
MPALSVNLNKVALLRNSRTIGIPSVVDAARTCIAAGADGITVHPRPDGRHIRREDVFALGEVVGAVEYNIEGNPVPEFMRLVREIRPTQCTLVPDSPAQLTSDHGWDLKREAARLAPLVAELRDLGVRVAIFMDPDLEQIALAPQVGADRIELYTEPYAAAFDTARREPVLRGYRAAAARAHELGLGVNAGHDLNLRNLPPFCAAVSGVLECSIGHALIADALWLGLAETVRRYRLACAG